MKVHIIKPYDLDKDLGRAYNQEMKEIPENDWACLMDLDSMFLTPDAGHILHCYAEKYAHAGLLTCYTNRLHESAKDQLLDGIVSENLLLDYHMERAYHQKRLLFNATPINHEVSGMLMMISKATWSEVRFKEGGKCLGVDNEYCWDLMKAGKSIYRMDGLYILHLYRLKNGVKDKTHLK